MKPFIGRREGEGGWGFGDYSEKFLKKVSKNMLNCIVQHLSRKWYNFHTIIFLLLLFYRKSKCSFFQVPFKVPYYKKSPTCKSNFTFMSVRFFYRYADFSEAIFKAFFIKSIQKQVALNIWSNDQKIKYTVNKTQLWVSGYLNI